MIIDKTTTNKKVDVSRWNRNIDVIQGVSHIVAVVLGVFTFTCVIGIVGSLDTDRITMQQGITELAKHIPSAIATLILANM